MMTFLLSVLAVASSAVHQDSARSGTQRLPPVEVIAAPAYLARLPGSAGVLTRDVLRRSRVFTTTEALRKIAGIHARDEEGLGLRPNIGIRGLSPSRSTGVLLLEDGVPFTLAPYGDNASYYHPALDRFDRIEVVKGAGQIQFGPRTIGGVVNYVTRPIPAAPSGAIDVRTGNRGLVDVRARYGGTWGGAGLLVDLGRRTANGARDNIGSSLADGTVKATLSMGDHQSLVLKASVHAERSRITYSGLTEAEWAAAPRQNPFRNDSMLLDRTGLAATHRLELGPTATLTVAGYAYRISRDWWRQSSNSTERPNDASDPRCGGLANLSTTCGTQGRLREYRVQGLEPRIRADFATGEWSHQVDAGLRIHHETQDRRQVNGAFPSARTPGPVTDPNSGTVEDNLRRNTAASAFVQHRLLRGAWTATAGLRVEHVDYQRINRQPVAGHPEGVQGRSSLTQLIPGLGVTLLASESATLFAGVHRGFAPPRTEDLIDNTTGGVVDLEPEYSWNYEAGIRAQPVTGLTFETTAFRMDFQNQIVPASVAGGSGAVLTSAGRTEHSGIEVAATASTRERWSWRHDLSLSLAYTWIPVARFAGERYAFVGRTGADVIGKVYGAQNGTGTRDPVAVTGNRLPYAPRHLLTAGLGWALPNGVGIQVEAVHVGAQFGDPLNTTVTVADGQQGPIPAVTLWNLTLQGELPGPGLTGFVAIKNLFDELYLADRTRGLLPGSPRMVQVGTGWRF